MFRKAQGIVSRVPAHPNLNEGVRPRIQVQGTQKEERGYTGGVAPFGIKPDDDLLSHGETPHYHRR